MKKIVMSQISGMNLHYMLYSLDYFLDEMVKYEMPNVELWGGYPHLYSEDMTPAQVTSIRKKMEKRDLQLVCYTPEQLMYANNIAAPEADIRKRSLDYFLKNIEITAELGTDRMLMTSGWGYYHEPIDEAWKYARESLTTLAEKAEEKGITLLLEPLQPFESNLVTNVKELKQMLDDVNKPALKGMLDLVAMAVAKDTVTDYFRLLGDQLWHIHLIDGKPSGHLACGDGTLPLSQYLDEIAQFNYTGFLSLEIASTAYYTRPGQEFKKSVDYVKGILA